MMKRWLFTLTDPAAELRVVQVLAPSKLAAVSVVAKELRIDLDLARATHNRVIATAAGEDANCETPRVEFFVRNDGTRVEAA